MCPVDFVSGGLCVWRTLCLEDFAERVQCLVCVLKLSKMFVFKCLILLRFSKYSVIKKENFYLILVFMSSVFKGSVFPPVGSRRWFWFYLSRVTLF